MDIKQIRQLVKEGRTVVLVEDGQSPLVISVLESGGSERMVPVSEEVPIMSRLPKARTIHEEPRDHLLERLNKEILALKAEIAQQEELAGQGNN
jgi:hypothetical protein